MQRRAAAMGGREAPLARLMTVPLSCLQSRGLYREAPIRLLANLSELMPQPGDDSVLDSARRWRIQIDVCHRMRSARALEHVENINIGAFRQAVVQRDFRAIPMRIGVDAAIAPARVKIAAAQRERRA
jgi:hypothetical protein